MRCNTLRLFFIYMVRATAQKPHTNKCKALQVMRISVCHVCVCVCVCVCAYVCVCVCFVCECMCVYMQRLAFVHIWSCTTQTYA